MTLITVTGCYPNWWKPHGYLFKYMPKDGSPEYRLAWKHGCESGLGTAFGGTLYKHFYTWTKDQKMLNEPDYTKVFWMVHLFCRHVVLGTLQMANMEAPLPGDKTYPFTSFTIGTHNLGSIYQIRGTGNAWTDNAW